MRTPRPRNPRQNLTLHQPQTLLAARPRPATLPDLQPCSPLPQPLHPNAPNRLPSAPHHPRHSLHRLPKAAPPGIAPAEHYLIRRDTVYSCGNSPGVSHPPTSPRPKSHHPCRPKSLTSSPGPNRQRPKPPPASSSSPPHHRSPTATTGATNKTPSAVARKSVPMTRLTCNP